MSDEPAQLRATVNPHDPGSKVSSTLLVWIMKLNLPQVQLLFVN